MKHLTVSFFLCCVHLTILLGYVVSETQDDFEGGGLTFNLEHSLDSGSSPFFTPRGQIHVRSYKSGAGSISAADLSDEDRGKLKELAAKDEYYRVRVPLPDSDVRGGQAYVSSYMRACALVESRLSDLITLNVDQQGRAVGVSVSTSYPVYCSGRPTRDADLALFNSTVDISSTVAAPQPDTASYVQKVNREKKMKERRDKEDQGKGFFAKYWMYIVPFVVIMVISSSMDQSGAQG